MRCLHLLFCIYLRMYVFVFFMFCSDEPAGNLGHTDRPTDEPTNGPDVTDAPGVGDQVVQL